MAMLRFLDDNMGASMDDNRVPADQSQALPSARPITERLNFAITGSGEWSAENLFIFPENVTHPNLRRFFNSSAFKFAIKMDPDSR